MRGLDRILDTETKMSTMPHETVATNSSSQLLLHQLANNNDNGKVLFGKYEIGRLLGRGAFAKVYHARHVETRESVAIKAVNKRSVIKSGHVENIKREITIMRQVRHPNVIRLREVLATKTKIFFVMDFAKGGELFSRVARGGRFGEPLCRRYFRQLISAVGHCHRLGIFHRDIKPENLLLDADWNLKVTDFGLGAVVPGGDADKAVLQTICGTPAYVAPEMLAKKGYGGAAADVWSCGVVLFVMAAGYLPFNDASLMNMYRKIWIGEYRCPRWFSPGLRQLISRLLDTNPERRITIEEICDDPWLKEGLSTEEEEEEEDDDDVDEAALGSSSGSGSDDSEMIESGYLQLDLKCNWKGDQEGGRFLNAFDIISHSSGLDLSGLFEVTENSEMFVSGEKVERIIERVEEGVAAIREQATAAEVVVLVNRKEGWVWIEGPEDCFVISVRVHRLTEKLVAIEVKRTEKEKEKEKEGGGCHFWKDKLRPQILELSLSKATGSVSV